MANEFKVRKGLIVDGSTQVPALVGTVVDVQGTAGQLFSVTDSLTGDLFSVSDVSGVPIFNINSSGEINIGDDDKLYFGASNDLQIYHDGSNSYIAEVGSGGLVFKSNHYYFQDTSGNTAFNVSAPAGDATFEGSITSGGNIISNDTFYLQNSSGKKWQYLFDGDNSQFRHYNGSSWGTHVLKLLASSGINVTGEYTTSADYGNSGFIQTWRNTNTGGGAYVEHIIGNSASSELRIGHAPNYGSADWNASWVYAVGKPLFLKSSNGNVVIYAGGAGASDEVAIFDTSQNTRFKGDVQIDGGITSALNNSILISYSSNDGNNNDAGLKIMNDSNDWGAYIRKTSSGNYGLRIDSGGASALSIYSTTGGSTKTFGVDGSNGNTGIAGIVTTDKIFVAKGQNVTHGTSQIKISQENSTKSQIRFYGADTSTAGILEFTGSSSDGSAGGVRLTINADGSSTFSGAATYHKIKTYYDGDYTSGFKFSDYNGGIWYDAGADDLTLNGGHANSQILFNSGGALALTLNASQLATFEGTILIDGVSNYTGLEVKGAGASRPSVQFSNANQGDLGQIYGTESNALVIATGTGSNTAVTLNSNQTVNFHNSVYFSGSNVGLISWGSMGGGTGFGIRGESGRALSLGSNGAWDKLIIDTSGNTTFAGSLTMSASGNVFSDSIFQFLNTGSGAQYGKFRGIQLSTSYSGTIPSQGILFGTDTNLYRSAANTLKTDDDFVINSSSASGSTVLDVQGSEGQLFSVTNSLSGDLFSVSDVSGVPIFNVNSSGAISVDGYIEGNLEIKSTGSVGLTINADTDNATESDIPFLSFKMDGAMERLRIGVDASNNPYISTDSDSNLPLKILTGTNNGSCATFNADKTTTFHGNIHTDVVNNGANSHNMIYRTGGKTLVGGGSSANKLYVDDTGNVTVGGNSNATTNAYGGTGVKSLNIQAPDYPLIAFYAGSTPALRTTMISYSNSTLFTHNHATAKYTFQNSTSNTGELSGTGTFTVKGDVIAYGSPSDISLKENIKPIESALDKVNKLKGVTFDWKESDSILDIKEDIGFIAQDVQEVLPELVRENDNGKLSLRDKGIVPVLVEAIKELKEEIEQLKKQINNG